MVKGFTYRGIRSKKSSPVPFVPSADSARRRRRYLLYGGISACTGDPSRTDYGRFVARGSGKSCARENLTGAESVARLFS